MCIRDRKLLLATWGRPFVHRAQNCCRVASRGRAARKHRDMARRQARAKPKSSSNVSAVVLRIQRASTPVVLARSLDVLGAFQNRQPSVRLIMVAAGRDCLADLFIAMFSIHERPQAESINILCMKTQHHSSAQQQIGVLRIQRA